MRDRIEPSPYPMTEEDYELLCECLGSTIIDKVIEERES
jgi:hypothetical protein